MNTKLLYKHSPKARPTNWLKLAVLALLLNEAANYAATAFMDKVDRVFDAGSVWCILTAALYLTVATLTLLDWRR